MNRRVAWTVGASVAIVGFVAFGVGTFRDNLTPYVSFEKARRSSDAVQVAGSLVPGSDRYDESSSRLIFAIADERGDTLEVAYKGLKPGNFNEATQIVAIGRYRGDRLEAEKLLVKCPSKYQGVEEKQYTSDAS